MKKLKVTSLKEIMDLKIPLDGFVVQEYYIVITTNHFTTVTSGLNNPIMKSPYFYEDVVIGDNHVERAIINFNKYLNEIYSSRRGE